MNDAHELSQENAAKIDEIVATYKGDKGSLLEVLHRVQDVFGYIPKCVQSYIAKRMKIPVNQVHGIVTFYDYFTENPKGDHIVRVCLGTACYVRGGDRVLKSLEEELGITKGGVTEDRKFSLEVVRCLGACALAPVMVVDKKYHDKMTSLKVSEILSGI